MRRAASIPFRLRQPDVEHNQSWLQFYGFLNPFQPVSCFANDLQTRPRAQSFPYESTKRFVIIDH